MKKFSDISNFKVNSDKTNITDTETNNLDPIKYAINKLIKEFLKIEISGPIDPILEGTIRIIGEEEFTNSILDLFKTKEVSDSLKLLKEAKFNGLDNSISLFESIINEKQTQSMILKHDRRIEDIMRRSQGVKEKALSLANVQSNRIKDGEKAFYRGLSAERMIGTMDKDGNTYDKSTLSEISNIFIHRSKQLGYRK